MTTAPQLTPYLSATTFQGCLRGETGSVDVSFAAEIDASGLLHVVIEPLPANEATWCFMGDHDVDHKPSLFALKGSTDSGWSLSSESFFLTSHASRTDAGIASIYLEGGFLDAEFHRSVETGGQSPRLARWFQQLRGFGVLEGVTPLGSVVLQASSYKPVARELSGWISITAPGATVDDNWSMRSWALLDHVSRVMSLAAGTYLRPYLEVTLKDGHEYTRVQRFGPTPEPFQPPFHFLNLGPIFECACATFESREECLKALDPAFHWLLAGGTYNELRLMAAMTALEHIVDNSPEVDSLVVSKEKFQSALPAVEQVLTDKALPDEIFNKFRELNRASFRTRLQCLLHQKGMEHVDISRHAIREFVQARNDVVHKGIYYQEGEEQTDLFVHVLRVRELVTRLLLDALGFHGTYTSALHNNQDVSFPSCEVVARR